MGCCVSTTTSSAAPNSPILKPKSNKKCSNKSPPSSQPLLEEETVKEVLSETPIIPKQPSTRIKQLPENHRNEIQAPFTTAADSSNVVYKNHPNDTVLKKPYMIFNNDEISKQGIVEDESLSTEFTKRREDVKDVRKKSPAKLKDRSFSGELKQERAVKKSPASRPESCPVRVGSWREDPAVYGRRKDSGESSGRMSRSPVTRIDTGPMKTGLDRSYSSRRTGKSPGRVGSGLGERNRKVGDERKRPPTTTSNELLENPLVSLECFIFL